MIELEMFLGILQVSRGDAVWWQVLLTDFSAEVAAMCMNRLAKLSARFIGNRGFSIGIDDVTPAPSLQKAKAGLMRTGCVSNVTMDSSAAQPQLPVSLVSNVCAFY